MATYTYGQLYQQPDSATLSAPLCQAIQQNNEVCEIHIKKPMTCKTGTFRFLQSIILSSAIISIFLLFNTSQARQKIPKELLADPEKLLTDSRYTTKAAWEFHDTTGNITTGSWDYLDQYSLEQYSTKEFDAYVEGKKKSGHLYVWWDINRKKIFILGSYSKGKLSGFYYLCKPDGSPWAIYSYEKSGHTGDYVTFDESDILTEESFIIFNSTNETSWTTHNFSYPGGNLDNGLTAITNAGGSNVWVSEGNSWWLQGQSSTNDAGHLRSNASTTTNRPATH